MKGLENYKPKCPLCNNGEVKHHANAKDIEYFVSEKTYSYYTCKNCDIIFLNNPPINELNLIYPTNYYSFGKINSKGFAFKIKGLLDRIFFKKILKNLSQEKLKIIDVGGGTGWLIDSIKKFEKRICVSQIADIDAGAKEEAIKNGHQFFLGKFEDFNDNNKYDVILMLNLIEHVANPIDVLKKAHNLLTDDGILILKTPNHNSWDARIFKNSSWGGYHCPRHWIIFSDDSATKVIKKLGYEIVYKKLTQGAPFWAVSFLNFLKQRKIIKASKEKPLVYHSLYSIISIAFATFDYIRSPFAKTSQMFFVLKKDK